MSYCLNPNCSQPLNPNNAKFCSRCGWKLLLGDRYRAIKRIGGGGFSKTFLAVDEDKPSKPPCVIKQFRQQSTQNHGGISESFRQEVARLDAIGQYPQIPTLLADFDGGDRQYVVQEFIHGQNLAEELAETGTFNESQITRLLEELLPVLHVIHSHRLIHRDIKPENIIRRYADGKLVLVDFGAAKHATETALSKVGTLIGSAEFTAPEQLMGKAIFASDIYSLGVTCIHLLTQLPPFDLYNSAEGCWVWRDYLMNPIGDRLCRILDRMLMSANRRYHEPEEVLKDLNPDLILPILPVLSKPPAATPPPAAPLEPVVTLPQVVMPPPLALSWQCVNTLAGSSSGREVTAIAFSAQSRTVVSSSWDATIKLWDLGSGTLLHTLTDHTNGVVSLAICADGQTLASGSADATIKIWRLWQLSPADVRLGGVISPQLTLIGHTSVVASVAISSDGETVVSGSRDTTIGVWNLKRRELLRTLTGHSAPVNCVDISLDGRAIASGCQNGAIAIWQMDTGEVKLHLTDHGGAVYAVAISPDGKNAISTSWDRTIKIWDLQNGRVVRSLSGHLLPAVSVVVSPDGKTFATGSHDATIKLWNLETGEVLATLSGHSKGVTTVAFSPDGKTIASGSQDGSVKLWRCEGLGK